MLEKSMSFSLALLVACCLLFSNTLLADSAYIEPKVSGFEIKQALQGLQGQPQRGRQIVISDKGTCLTCHKMPIPEEFFHGTLGPDLSQVAQRFNEAELRLRVVDEKRINPLTIMPGYYRDPAKLNLVASDYENKTLLTPQEIEDVVAYLLTLK